MSDIVIASPSKPSRQFTGRLERPDIKLPDGRTLRTRALVATGLGVHEKTVTRLNCKTWYFGNIAYVEPTTVLKRIEAGAKQRNEPPARRRRHS